MTCHNGSQSNDYTGPGLENPHPYGVGGSKKIKCTVCHGGNPNGENPSDAHVPPPPEIGDDAFQAVDDFAYFNRLTLTGIDKLPNYTVGGKTYSAIDYLQFINPGDLRVVTAGRSCGQCHGRHTNVVNASPLATETGILGGALYAIGQDNQVPSSVGLYEDTASDLAFRAVVDPNFQGGIFGSVREVIEHPVFSVQGGTGQQTDIFQNPDYDVAELVDDREADNQVVSNSALANLYHEQVAFTCGDCHLGSAGANNRYGDFRSSGCTACHMRYALDGRSNSGDPNVNIFEPADPDQILEPEQSHIDRHLIRTIAKTLPSGEFVTGIDDYTCAGCHQGSNRTVMQYWGIRLDQNEDVRDGFQYPADPNSFTTTNNDPRLFDPVVNNNTFNGRNHRQYLLEEDYDNDGLDDTPPDVHYEAGLGCIDCHGSYDLHGGDTTSGNFNIRSRMEQPVAITCETCHGAADAYAATVAGTTYAGVTADLAVDEAGNALQHVYRDANGDYYLTSRLTGNTHFVPQTLDVVVDSGRLNPLTLQPVYSAKASYAMGRADGSAATGIGPQQTAGVTPGFSHVDNLSCAACHSSWTNNCIGCHLKGEYQNNNFSNITGERIVFEEDEAQFVYQSPVMFQLGVGPDNKIDTMLGNTDMFFQWEDRQNNNSQIFTFSDRNGQGNNPAISPFPALQHNVMMQHSIRGKVDANYEGPRYCLSCHNTDAGLATYGAQYTAFQTAMATNDFASLDFNVLQTHIGRNTGNRLNSPLWVHMVAGLGSGLFLFDEDGCAVNPLDNNPNRYGCNNVSPASIYDPARATLNLDRIVEPTGVSNGGNNHAMFNPGALPDLRDGATDPNMSGPLGATLIQLLTDPVNGLVLDSWLDADGNTQGDAGTFIP